VGLDHAAQKPVASSRHSPPSKAVRLLGCASSTATRYLRMIETEGFVERIHTSSVLRTSCFAKKVPRD
jgi:hypothetical protein